MAKITSAIEIVNLALSHLKEEPIASFEDGTKTANEAKRFYDVVRRATLREMAWNFATKRVSIAPLEEAPEFGFKYQFSLPNDYLRLVKFNALNNEDYELEAGKILMNSSNNLELTYIYDCETVALFDPQFILYLSYNLAIQLCYPITGSSAATKRVAELRSEIQIEAKATDSQERPPKRIRKSRYLIRRLGRG